MILNYTFTVLHYSNNISCKYMASWAARQKIWIVWLTKWDWTRYFVMHCCFSHQLFFQHCSVLICHCPWDMRYVQTAKMLEKYAAISRIFVFDPAVVCTQLKEVYVTWTSDESYTVKLTSLSISLSFPNVWFLVFKNDAILFWLRWVIAVQYF